jgi:hypothetical protein
VRLEDCITEGGNPVNSIKHDDEASTVCKFFSVKNHHSENTPSNAVILSASMGRVNIDSLWHQSNCIMIDATGSNNAAFFHVTDLPWIPFNPAFKTAGTVAWLFDYPGSGGIQGVNATAAWSGGTIPTGLHFRGVSSAAQALADINTLRVRGNAGGGGGVLEVYTNQTDANPVFQYHSSFGLNFGPGGGTAVDTRWYRSAANVMGTDDNLALEGAGTYEEFKENGTTDAAAGAANTGRLYVKDNGAGKTQLCVRFNTGAVQVIATEP